MKSEEITSVSPESKRTCSVHEKTEASEGVQKGRRVLLEARVNDGVKGWTDVE